jgi:hypothetical protein
MLFKVCDEMRRNLLWTNPCEDANDKRSSHPTGGNGIGRNIDSIGYPVSFTAYRDTPGFIARLLKLIPVVRSDPHIAGGINFHPRVMIVNDVGL